MQTQVRSVSPIGPLGLGGAGGSGLSWAAEHFHWQWPRFVIYIVLIVSIISLITAVVLSVLRMYQWTKQKLAEFDFLLARIVVAVRHRLIPVMLGVMGAAGALLIIGAVLGAIAYSNSWSSSVDAGTTTTVTSETSETSKAPVTAAVHEPPSKPAPKYLSEMSLNFSSGEILRLDAVSAVTDARLRLFVEEDDRKRVFIGEIKKPIQGQPINIVLLRQAPNGTLWWGNLNSGKQIRLDPAYAIIPSPL